MSESISLSLNEVESLCAKAVHGVGYPWGVAADSAKAVRWLAERNLSGLACLEQALKHKQSHTIILATSLADKALSLAESPLAIKQSDSPLLLVPFLAWASALTQTNLQADFGTDFSTDFGTDFSTGSATVSLRFVSDTETTEADSSRATTQVYGDLTSLPERCSVSVRPVAASASSPTPSLALWQGRATRLVVEGKDLEVFARLEELAHNTYAPATEESRRSGAGSALSDND